MHGLHFHSSLEHACSGFSANSAVRSTIALVLFTPILFVQQQNLQELRQRKREMGERKRWINIFHLFLSPKSTINWKNKYFVRIFIAQSINMLWHREQLNLQRNKNHHPNYTFEILMKIHCMSDATIQRLDEGHLTQNAITFQLTL